MASLPVTLPAWFLVVGTVLVATASATIPVLGQLWVGRVSHAQQLAREQAARAHADHVDSLSVKREALAQALSATYMLDRLEDQRAEVIARGSGVPDDLRALINTAHQQYEVAMAMVQLTVDSLDPALLQPYSTLSTRALLEQARAELRR